MSDVMSEPVEILTEVKREGVLSPPADLDFDLWRSWLGGCYTAKRGGRLSDNPYVLGPAVEAWRRGFAAQRKDVS